MERLFDIEKITREELKNLKEEWKPKMVMEYMVFLEKNKAYKHAYKYYCVLCDFSHPNIGTNRIFFQDSEIKKEKTQEHYQKFPQQASLFFMMAPYPIKISCEIIRGGINALRNVKFVNNC